MSAPLRAAVTGAPGAGKSTLLDEIAKHGVTTGPEVARSILQQPDGMALRRGDPGGFALAMLDAQLRSWDRFADCPGPVLFDRGFPDIVGFLEVEDLPVPTRIERACRERRYTGPIFHAPAWKDIYRQDEERIQTWEEAIASDRAVTGAWKRYGYNLVALPLAPPDVRASHVLARLS